MRHLELGQIIAPAQLRRAANNKFPVLSMTMRDGLVNQADKFKKRIASADTSSYKVVKRNQLVVGFPIDEGVLAFQNLYDEAIVSPAYNIWNLQDNVSVDSKYLEQFLRSPSALVFYTSKLRSTTARRRTLPNDIFLSLSVPVPPLAEQKRIVKLLGEADELRKLRTQAGRCSAALIPALFHETFGDPLGRDGHWPSVTIESIAAQEKYSIVDGPFGASLKQADYRESGVPVIRIKKIFADGKFVERDFLYISELKHEELKRSAIKGGDILVSRVGTLGNSCIYPGTFPKALLSTTGVCKITVDDKKVDRVFLHSLILTPQFQQQIKNSSSSAVQSYFNLTALRNWRLILPPLSQQREFAQRVTEIRELEASQATSRTRLDALFQSMLHRAFNGEL